MLSRRAMLAGSVLGGLGLRAARADGPTIRLGSLPVGTSTWEAAVIKARGLDVANGFTTVVPYDLVELRAVPPESDAELGVTDEYLRMLVIHEVAHVVHLDTIHGIPALVNLAVGKVWPPNIVQPRFVVEGLATWIETEHTEAVNKAAAPLRAVATANQMREVRS